ncbi:hypothetical protein [Vibrio sp. 1S139]|uniref:hypothetical protein n=1 Tax=Vibrio sp. 1S139 TaxID=3230006 RepID=UPI00352BEED1
MKRCESEPETASGRMMQWTSNYLVETCTTIWKLSTSAARAIVVAKQEVLYPKLV